jgi:hypothetical protein
MNYVRMTYTNRYISMIIVATIKINRNGNRKS